MKKITASELKNKTSDALSTAQHEPVLVEKNGRVVAVIVAHADYQRLTQLENEYWLARIEASEKGGYLGTEATAEFFKEMLSKNAEV